MNILAIDYGQKRIGLAWVQTGLDIVLPFGVVENTGDIPQALLNTITEEGVDRIVIGLPIGMEGQENANTERIKTFGDVLQKETGKDIVFVDERFSSAQADAMGGDASRDEKSAMVILQSYIDTL